jgi:6-pyruvoyltetrahydropterin/6-carboxytetrahydropterin synthase
MNTTDNRQSLTRRYHFAAVHYYHDTSLSPAENERLFGTCANQDGHGHDYRLEVTLRGPVNERTGMLLDLRELDRIVEEAVLRHVEHRNLNRQVPFFASHQPTCENLARWAWQELQGRLPGCRLARVRVHESDDLHADCEAPGPESA